MNQEIEQLIFKAYHGDLSEVERDVLSRWVAASPDNARQVLEYSADAQSIQIALQDGQFENADGANELVNAKLAAHETIVDSSASFSFQNIAATLLAITAIVGLTLWIGTMRQNNDEFADLVATMPAGFPVELAEELPADVEIIESVEVEWNYYTSHRDESRTYDIPVGFVHYEFEGDGFILLEGPTKYQLRNDHTIRLIEGKLVAKAPTDVDQQLSILIDDTEITILDAECGVENIPNVAASIIVFEGTVEVARDQNGIRSSATRVNSQEVGRLLTDTGKVDQLARATQADAVKFSRSAHGVDYQPSHLANTVRYLTDVPASLKPGKLANRDHAWLFCEGTDVSVKADELPAFPNRLVNIGNVPADQLLDSYLLHFDAQVDGNSAGPQVTGTVTFDRPILGVLGAAQAMRSTDAFFGSADTTYPRDSGAGHDDRNVGSCGIEFDVDGIKLSDDRKTLLFRFTADQELDQVRILVEAKEPDAK